MIYKIISSRHSSPWQKKNLSDFGIITQCMSPTRVNDQYLTNVLLKINAKVWTWKVWRWWRNGHPSALKVLLPEDLVKVLFFCFCSCSLEGWTPCWLLNIHLQHLWSLKLPQSFLGWMCLTDHLGILMCLRCNSRPMNYQNNTFTSFTQNRKLVIENVADPRQNSHIGNVFELAKLRFRCHMECNFCI